MKGFLNGLFFSCFHSFAWCFWDRGQAPSRERSILRC